MQMYLVKFAKKVSEDTVDVGDVLVCAANRDAACDMVATLLSLPRSSTEMTASRVKPSLHVLSRREAQYRMSTFVAETIGAWNASTATFPTKDSVDEFWFELSASANIRAEDESAATRKLATAIHREMSGEPRKSSVKDLDISCERSDLRPRAPAVEQNAIYSVRRIFQGGDTRT